MLPFGREHQNHTLQGMRLSLFCNFNVNLSTHAALRKHVADIAHICHFYVSMLAPFRTTFSNNLAHHFRPRKMTIYFFGYRNICEARGRILEVRGEHGGGIIEEELWSGIMVEESSWRRSHGERIMEENHGVGITVEESWRRNPP